MSGSTNPWLSALSMEKRSQHRTYSYIILQIRWILKVFACSKSIFDSVRSTSLYVLARALVALVREFGMALGSSWVFDAL
jgi:hypothetical protein